MKYRKDINGLRSLAVMPVLFFHAGWEFFSGGFLGVDVFFVISGYLITSLIFQGLDDGSFSTLSFYDKRLRRIVPALFVVLIITTLLAPVFMLPYDLKNYGQSVVATVLSANNILLYLTSGYWSLAAEFKPLYHTWSLGVEEQYYFVIPLVLMFCFTFAKKLGRSYFLVLFPLLVVSLVISYTSESEEWNFLIITNRMWELLSGSLVALLLRYNVIKSSTTMSIVGLFLILYSYIYPYSFSDNQVIVNLIPVLGVCLVIIFSSDEKFTGKLLSFPPLFFIGTLSYSIYLFHMPILALLRLSMSYSPSVLLQTAFVSLSIPIAYLTWRYIENPFRKKDVVSNKAFYITISFSTCLLLAVGLMMHKTYGFREYFYEYDYGNNPQRYADGPMSMRHESFTEEKLNMLVVGNSFGRDFINMMSENNVLDKFEVIYLPDFSNIGVSTTLLKDSDVVVSVSSAGIGAKVDADLVRARSIELKQFILQKFDGTLYRVGTKNFGRNNNFVRQMTYREAVNFRVTPNQSSMIANNIEKEVWGHQYVDVLGTLSDENQTVRIFTPKGKFISFDTEHITRSGAKYVGELLLTKTKLKHLVM
jgi:peptidoglycan/LPS O-acetylase OafA/YrhL